MNKFPTQRSDTRTVSIGCPPQSVWQLLSDVHQWPHFSPFALAVDQVAPGTFNITSPQGPVILHTRFNEELGLLDHLVELRDGTKVLIPYRVVPNHEGSELIMTNVKSPNDSDEDYLEQLQWMEDELQGAKTYVQSNAS